MEVETRGGVGDEGRINNGPNCYYYRLNYNPRRYIKCHGTGTVQSREQADARAEDSGALSRYNDAYTTF